MKLHIERRTSGKLPKGLFGESVRETKADKPSPIRTHQQPIEGSEKQRLPGYRK